jgi:hypothetical protein
MSTSATIRPINSLLFISDRDGGEVPEWVRDELILSTPSCIAVGCYPEPDGPTTVTLGLLWQVEHDEKPAFSGSLETPNRAVAGFDGRSADRNGCKGAQYSYACADLGKSSKVARQGDYWIGVESIE